MIVVSNTSPITNLAAIGRLDLLHQIYREVVVPEAVFQELTAEAGQHPGAIVRQLDWIHRRSVSNSADRRAIVLRDWKIEIQSQGNRNQCEQYADRHHFAVFIEGRKFSSTQTSSGLRF